MCGSFIETVLVLLAVSHLALGGEVSTDGFETGHVDGQPLRNHEDWFFEQQNADPTCQEHVGVGKSWGVAPGDRAFTWIAKPFAWNDSELAYAVFGGDWQTDSSGRLDDDRVGWSISDKDDSSDNIFGVQIDPAGVPAPSGGVQLFGFRIGGETPKEPELNIEAYWDGDTMGDDGCRTSILTLPKLKPNTWYRLRAKFTKLTSASAKIDVSFVQLDDSGNPTGKAHTGTLEDTSALSDTEGNERPNPAYLSASAMWPVFKNFGVLEGGFDNAYFEAGYANGSTESTASSQ